MQWHQLDYLQTICTLIQTDNYTITPPLIFTGRVPFLPPSQECQSTEDTFSVAVRLSKMAETGGAYRFGADGAIPTR